jgi:hypothetical protein
MIKVAAVRFARSGHGRMRGREGRMKRRGFLVSCAGFVLVALTILLVSVGHADDSVAGSGPALLAKYPTLSAKLQRNQFAAPIFLESSESGGAQQVDMYGVFNYPFDTVRDALQSPANWCDITALHINIKACTARKSGDRSLLTIYSGRKNYQVPADAYPLKLTFRALAQQSDYLNLMLSAQEGPLGTKDHRIRLEATPLDAGRTFVHFSYAYRHGAMANLAIKTYFATIARDKLGFSSYPGANGAPVLIGGVRGAVERNTVRYYLALQTYLDTLKVPEAQRFELRLSRWYDLTARYPRQLKEMEKSEYLATKRREHLNQISLQKEVR